MSSSLLHSSRARSCAYGRSLLLSSSPSSPSSPSLCSHCGGNKYIAGVRYYAKKKQDGNDANPNSPKVIKGDKTTEEFKEILQWWKQKKKTRLDLRSVHPPRLRTDFLTARQNFKIQELTRLETMRDAIIHGIERRKAALNALPPRLSFACQISYEPQWREQLSNHIALTYDKLHLLNYSEADEDNTYERNAIDPRTGTPVKLNEADLKFESLLSGTSAASRSSSQTQAQSQAQNAVYSVPKSLLDDFPPMYDPGDIRTQPAYVRSLFDYQWREGMVAPIKGKAASLDPNQSVLDDTDRQIYGQDMSGLRFGKVTKSGDSGGSIGGGIELKRKLMGENQKLTPKQKAIMREQQKRTQQMKGANDYKVIQQQKAEQRKVRRDLKRWHREIKTEKKRKNAITEQLLLDEEEGPDANLEFQDGVELTESQRKERATKRMEELALLSSELPKLEELLVNKALNKKFFEDTMPVVLNHPMTNDSKKHECILLLRKYHTLQSHVGYGAK